MQQSPSREKANPILVDVKRGDQVESVHRGAFCVVDAEGNIRAAAGDVERPTFPRSSVKMLQALPLLESGAADHFRLIDMQIALACASHNGEEGHIDAVRNWLTSIGATPDQLECGCHQPFHERAALDLAAQGCQPTPLHNNCSGKHTGFITTARHRRLPVGGYVDAGHAVQQAVTAALSEMMECELCGAPRGTDGCGIPTYAVPLIAVARAMAKIASPDRLGPTRGKAARRIFEAMTAHPWFVGGTGRFDTQAMRAGNGAVIVKMGAEGVHVAAHRELGLGIALKIDDGARRAADSAMGALMQKFAFLGAPPRPSPELMFNSRGEKIGVVCAVFDRSAGRKGVVV
jgi:L-asparaginase II